MSAHLIEEIDPRAERAAIVALHRAVYPGSDLDDDTYDWRYLQVPGGTTASAQTSGAPAPILGVRADGGLAAQTVLWPRRLSWHPSGQSEPRPAWLMIDVMTHPDHRGRGMLAAMSRHCQRLGLERGHFVLGYPNERSVKGYLGTGWAAPQTIPAWEGAVDPSKAAAAGSLRPIAPEDVGPWVEALWRAMDRIGVHRDAEYLSWRLRRPGAGYRVFASPDRDALAVLKRYEGGSEVVLNLCELLVAPGHDALADAALALAHAQAVDLGAARISAWATPGSPAAAALSRGGLAPAPSERVMLWQAPRSEGTDDRPWHVAQLDSDVF